MKQNKEDEEISFEYKPIETEMGNYKEDKDSNDHMSYGRMNDEDEEEYEIDKELNSISKALGESSSIQSLQSLRISHHSQHNKRDNENYLLERLNMCNGNNKNEAIVLTSPSLKKGRLIMTNTYDESKANDHDHNHHQVNAIVSESNLHKKSNEPINQLFTESTVQQTTIGDNKTNANKDFRAIQLNYIEGLRPITHYVQNNNTCKGGEHNKPFSIKKRSNCKTNDNTKLNNRNLTNNKQYTYDLDQKRSAEKNSISKTISDILNKMNQKHINNVYKVKSRVSKDKWKDKDNCKNTSKAQRNTTASTKVITNNSHWLINNQRNVINSSLSNNLTPFNSRMLKQKANKQSSQPKQKIFHTNIDPLIKAKLMNQQHTTTKYSIKPKQKHSTLTQCNNNNNNSNNNNSNGLHINDTLPINYTIFHTIQSINNKKVKNSLLNTLSKKTMTNKIFHNSIKPINVQSSIESKTIFNNNTLKHIDTSSKDKGMRMINNKTTFQIINKTMQLNTPINMKPYKYIYKAHCQESVMTPLKSIKKKSKAKQKKY